MEKLIPTKSKIQLSTKKKIVIPKKNCQRLVTDKEVIRYGVQILRRPPYHSEFNPIEMIWGIMKDRILIYRSRQSINLINLFPQVLPKKNNIAAYYFVGNYDVNKHLKQTINKSKTVQSFGSFDVIHK